LEAERSDGVSINRRDCWIFDMDGTLTRANHDFDAIRAALELPADVPILEEIASRPESEAQDLTRRLDEIELEIAKSSQAQPGAHALLTRMAEVGWRIGILTRNSEAIAHETLAVSGLDGFFDPRDIVGRESSAPKPEPDGVHLLLSRWNSGVARGAIVGDYRYDLMAGRRAGVACVYFDPEGTRQWEAEADLRIERLAELFELLFS
jgi:HAD superfamily hydrolase (TIGR01549 family)